MKKSTEPVAIERAQIVRAFLLWAVDQPGTPPVEDAFTLAKCALEEMIFLRTAQFDDWYVRNHHRFMSLRELDRRRVRELARRFIAEIQLGKVSFAGS